MNINLKVEDESNNSFTSSFVVYVNDLNRTPTDIGVSSLTFPESVSASSTIATISAVDSNTSDTHVFTLVDGDGSNDADNSSFTISGTSLIINNTPDYETKSSYNIYINAYDGANNFAKAFTVSVTDINEAPTDIGLTSNTITENASPSTVVGTFSSVDLDTTDTPSFTLATSGNTDDAEKRSAGLSSQTRMVLPPHPRQLLAL